MIGLNLLVLRCGDVERARRFYTCLGLPLELHRHGDGPDHWAAEDGDGVIELYPSSVGTTSAIATADRVGLGFGVEDLAATSAALAALGFEPGPIAERPWGTTFVVRDPDGRRVEVKGRK